MGYTGEKLRLCMIERRALDPTKHRANDKTYRKRHPKRNMVRIAKERARRKGIRFRLTEYDFDIPTHCPILGIPLTWAQGFHAGSATLDRIHPSLGYVPHNVRVISMRANLLKSDMTLAECRLILQDLEDRI